jgi:hypothetical protein
VGVDTYDKYKLCIQYFEWRVSLQGEHLLADAFVEAFSITKFGKNFKETSTTMLDVKAFVEVLAYVPYN